MAKLKLTELQQATVANPNDLLYIVQSGESKSISAQNILQTSYNISLQGNVTFGGEPQVISSQATVNLATPITYLRVQGTSQDIGIPNGANGQIKVFITQSSGGGSFSLRGNISGSGLNFSAVGDDAILVYSGNAWFVVGQTAFRSANSYVSSVNGKGPGEITLTTDDITEGNNLYYTEDRITPYLTTSNVIEGANLYFTSERLTPYLTTSNVIEGDNLYFTDERVADVLVITPISANLIIEEPFRQFFRRKAVIATYKEPLVPFDGTIQNVSIYDTYANSEPFIPALLLPVHNNETANFYVDVLHQAIFPNVIPESPQGALIYNSNIGKLQVYIGNTWANVALET
jgi:hypothetical protein